MHNFTSPCLVIRPTLPSDREAVLGFCKTIWDGGDYVPYVWDEWLADPRGQMFTAEYAGRAVGLGRLTHLAPGQWYLEGLRVDPQFHGQKIGTRLHDFLIAHWQEHCDGVVRLATTSTRPKVHHLCAHSGFGKLGEYSIFVAPPLAQPADAFQLVKDAEIPAAVDAALGSPSLHIGHSLMDIGWRYVTPNEDSLRTAVEKGLAQWWRGRQGLLTVWEDQDPDESRVLLVGMACCPITDLPALLMDFRRLAAARSYPKAAWMAPLHPDLLPALAAISFVRDWDEEMYVYEKHANA